MIEPTKISDETIAAYVAAIRQTVDVTPEMDARLLSIAATLVLADAVRDAANKIVLALKIPE
jgi:hypothetical protein